jgi:hypothetical protein
MKALLLSILSLCALVAAEPAKAPAESHAGRLLEAAGVKAEFLIKPDRHVALTFLDAAGKPAPRGERSVVIKVDGKDLTLEAKPEGFVSSEPLPAKEPAPIVVQVRPTADAKPTNFRLTLNTSNCGECRRQEYACTCAH